MAAGTPIRLLRFPTRWSPVKVLQSQNKLGVLVVDIIENKVINFVYPNEVNGGRKVREKVVIWVFQTLTNLKIN